MKIFEKKAKKLTLNLTSLIDVLFILIIFFTVSSTFLEQPGIELKLPEAESSEAHTTQKVIIYVNVDEKIYLNDQEVTLETVAIETDSLIAGQTDKSVVLRADNKAPHGAIISIMDKLRQKGIYKIVVSTEKPLK